MKTSPVQLLHLAFEKVSVELDPKHAPQEPYRHTAPFSFDGVTFRSSVGFADLNGSPSEEPVFEITLDLIVENKKIKGEKRQKFSPYLMHLKARAVVKVLKASYRLAPYEDLAAVNGAGLIWSAMREQVATLTSRMPAGQILLPTVHFQDLRSNFEAGHQKGESGSAHATDKLTE
jgi:hypothetical protein